MGKKIFILDIDGTICEDIRNEEGCEKMLAAKPFPDSIEYINRLYSDGNYICFFTSRTDEHKDVTIEWLKKNGLKYHQIIFNKPRRIGEYDEYHWIDNMHVKATTYKGKFTNFVKKKVEIEVFESDEA